MLLNQVNLLFEQTGGWIGVMLSEHSSWKAWCTLPGFALRRRLPRKSARLSGRRLAWMSRPPSTIWRYGERVEWLIMNDFDCWIDLYEVVEINTYCYYGCGGSSFSWKSFFFSFQVVHHSPHYIIINKRYDILINSNSAADEVKTFLYSGFISCNFCLQTQIGLIC